MQRVTLVSLNGNPYHIEEDAQLRLRAYLDAAQQRLAGSPDRAEVLGDLEQAVADQCQRRLAAGRTVITLAELEPALAEIGEVELPGNAQSASAPGLDLNPGGLRQISEGAMISGVCNGLARSMGVDLVLVRVIAVLLLFVTGGGMILLYLILMLLIPFAPLERPAQPLPTLPAKCREFAQYVRGKLGAAAH